MPFINNDPFPQDVHQGRVRFLSLARTLRSRLRTPTVVTDDSLVGGQHDVVLLELLWAEVPISPVISDVIERSRDAVLVYLRLPVR